MATGHFYKTSDDAGAPNLDNTAGSMIAVLDWALDTAGGTHWEKVYTDTNTAVFRATTGERFYFRLDDTFGGYCRFVSYQTMSDVDTGTKPFPGPGPFYPYLSLPKSDNGTGSAYWIVGDSRFFVVVVTFDDTYPFAKEIMFFGEPNAIDPLDTYSTIIGGCNSNATNPVPNFWAAVGFKAEILSYNNAATTNLHGDDACIFMADSVDGLAGSQGIFAMTAGAGINQINMSLVNFGAVALHPYWLLSCGNEVNNSDLDFNYRARLPYLYNIGTGGEVGYTDGDILEDGASDYKMLTYGNTTSLSNSNSIPLILRITDDEPGRA